MTSCCNLCHKQSSAVIFIKNGFDIVQCSYCGLVYVGNPPPEAELEKLYSFDVGYHREFQYDTSQYKKHYDIGRKHYKFIKKYKKQGRLLDIGCSAGFFLKVAKENKWETYGLEISRDTTKLARKRHGLEVLVGNLHQANFASKFFDAVTLWDVIEHVPDPMKTMSIVNRILKDDGIVALSTPNIDGLFPRLSYKASKIINSWPHPEPPYHLFQFSKKTIYKLFELTGFNLIETHDERNPITYTLHGLKSTMRFQKRFLYSAFLIPITLLGPIIHSGDWVTFVARKVREHKAINGQY